MVGYVFAPEILRGHQAGSGVGGAGFQLEGHAAQKGVVAQHAQAEAVDGVDGGGVEAGQDGLQLQDEFAALLFGQGFGQQVLQKLIVRRLPALQGSQNFAQPGTQAVFQLGGGGFGEGNHQYVFRRPAFEHHQAGEQRGNAVGFACAGGSLDKVGALRRQRQLCNVEILHGGVLGVSSSHG